jgi:hypothetical protein
MAEAVKDSDTTRLTSEKSGQLSPQAAPMTVIASPEPQPPTLRDERDSDDDAT